MILIYFVTDPVINQHYATHEDRLRAEPNIITGSTNRAILQPTRANRERRKSRIKSIQEDVAQHNKPGESSHRDSRGSQSSSNISKGKERLEALPVVGKLVRATSSDSAKSRSSQLVDLVVEDKEAEEIERVRARKEGGPGWNSVDPKYFVKTFPDEPAAEEVRQGFNPDFPERKITDEAHTLDEERLREDGRDDAETAVVDEPGFDQAGREQPWEERRYDADLGEEERDIWGDDDGKK